MYKYTIELCLKQDPRSPPNVFTVVVYYPEHMSANETLTKLALAELGDKIDLTQYTCVHYCVVTNIEYEGSDLWRS